MSGKTSSPVKKPGKPASSKKAKPQYSEPSGAAQGVYESARLFPVKEPQIESMLAEIITRLDRIEEKIDENVYPPESALTPDCIRQVKKAAADVRKGKRKIFHSVDDLFWEIEA
ncbi:MAG: hypothetical protein GYA23_10860 [Methanomicrobiales archaeon]|nr:hypothetical protein [Methanomicrobiales archaeon]